MEEAAALVPDHGALGRVRPVTELEQRHLAVGLPDEQVEIVVVEPASARGRVVGNSEDLFHP
jgi:hypothetical protein